MSKRAVPNYHADPKNAKHSPEAQEFFAKLRDLCREYDVLFSSGGNHQIIARMYHNPFAKGVETFDLGPVLNANTYPDFPI